VLIVIGAVGSWLMGDRLLAQFDELRERLPAAIEAARGWLGEQAIGKRVVETWDDLQDGGIPWERIGGAAGTTIGALGNAALMLLLGIYLAADPALYRDGFVRLMPRRYRARVKSALAAAGEGLGSWLVGQGVSMLFVGTATAIGLALLGSPLALSLGVIAGIFAFIPFFGPIASGILAVALAFIEGPRTALYVAGLCLGIQQVEGNVLMPFVQRWAAALPPVLGLVAVVVFGLLFGVMGVIFATPLMVVVMILVKKLYVHDVLEAASGP
jgi:predicted PurR-regulated permease PerM